MSVKMDYATSKRVEIYVRLLDEGTEVSRPTYALDLGNGLFRLEPSPSYDPEVETWEFEPGAEVRGELQSTDSGSYLMAVHSLISDASKCIE
jgi:hypothetical protein